MIYITSQLQGNYQRFNLIVDLLMINMVKLTSHMLCNMIEFAVCIEWI